jgi:hypothetical protein
MKKLFTLFGIVGLFFGLHAQQQTVQNHAIENNLPASGTHLQTHFPGKQLNNNSTLRSESTSSPAYLWYSNVDGAYATFNSGSAYYETFQYINADYPNSASNTWQWGAVLFDTLIQVLDAQNDVVKTYPLNGSTISLDSLDIFFIHDDSIQAIDTITVTVFDLDSFQLAGTLGSPSEYMLYNRKWDTVIITNSTIPLNYVYGGSSPTFTDLTFYPGLSFEQGKTFGVRVDFAGDTASHFALINSYSNLCAGSCVATNTVVGFNSLGYFNYEASGSNYSSVNYPYTLYFDCNHDGIYEPDLCENNDLQNWWIVSSVTITNPFEVGIIYDSLVSCNNNPPTQINLSANVLGSVAEPFSYNWSVNANGGSLSSTTDSSVLFTADSLTSIVSVTVTDANNVTTSASVTIASEAINVSFSNNPNPAQVACVQSNPGIQLVSRTGGAGESLSKTYVWSNNDSTQNIYVKTPGSYSVTVTNAEGCSASATIDVVYAGGVNNNVSFTGPFEGANGAPLTFINTSSDLNSGWSATWSMGDGGVVTTTNATYSYTVNGTYIVSLTMDSAGCSFTSAGQSVVITVSGITDIGFENSISLKPNPSSGNVLLTIGGADKDVSVTVYNILGEQVSAFEAGNISGAFSKQMNFNDFAAGTYLVKIQSGDKMAIKKVVITR